MQQIFIRDPTPMGLRQHWISTGHGEMSGVSKSKGLRWQVLAERFRDFARP